MSTKMMVPMSNKAAKSPKSRMASELMKRRLKNAPTVVRFPINKGLTISLIICSLLSVFLKWERK